MVLREIRRFLRHGRLTALLAWAVLTLGLCGAAVALNVMKALRRPSHAGLLRRSFVTIGQRTASGGLFRVDWYSVQQLRSTLVLPNAAMTAYAGPSEYQLEWGRQSAEVSVAFTDAEFFSAFASGLTAGRNFASGWESGAGEGEAIVSRQFGIRFFGSARQAVGQSITIAGKRFAVIGVAPANFRGLWTAADLWTTPDQAERLGTAAFRKGPIRPDSWKNPAIWYFLVAVDPNLRPAPVGTLVRQLREHADPSLHLQAVPGLTDDPVRDRNVHASFQLGFIVAIALLLSASLNYCLLLLGRSALSIEEYRLKYALGAGPRRLVIDAACGPLFVVLASFVAGGIATVLIQHFLRVAETDPIVASSLRTGSALKTLGMEFPLACLIGAAIASVPALSLVRKGSAPQKGMTTTHSARDQQILNGFVIVEIAVCTLMCVFAGAFLQEYYRLSTVRLGFNPHQLVSCEANIVTKGGGAITINTSSGARSPIEEFVRLSMLQAKEQLPGLQSIAASSCMPFGPPMKTVDVYPFRAGAAPASGVSLCTVSKNFFSAMGTSIYQGSEFTEGDYNGSVSHVIINRALARLLWPKQRAVGRSLVLTGTGAGLEFDAVVVGVAENARQAGPLSSPQPTVYLPLTGNAFVLSYPVYFLLRGTPSPEHFDAIVGAVSQSTVRHLGIVRSYRIDQRLQDSWEGQNSRLKIALFGSVLVALIAYVGLYGVVIHSVSARQKELALRLSFGASGWALRRVVVERTLLCCFAAILIALLLWRTCFGLLDQEWFGGVSWSWEGAALASTLCAIASVAISLIPSLRVLRFSPVELLKNE